MLTGRGNKRRDEMKMGSKATSLFLAVVCAFLMAGSAQAAQVFGGFQVDHTKTAGTGTLAGFDIYQFFALNLGTGPQTGTTRLVAIEMAGFANVNDPNTNIKFDFRDLDSDGVNDANVLGSGINLTQTDTTGSFVRVGAFTPNPGDAGFDPVGRLSADPDTGTTVRDPQTIFANKKSFRVVGFANPGALATPAQNSGKGAFFMEVVVPTGAVPKAVGKLSAESGPSVDIDYTAQVPEPTTMAVIGVAAVGFLSRRRRAA